MAEYRNKDRDSILLNDDLLKDAYKSGLNQLKASDELIEATLNKCRIELETHKRRPSKMLLSRVALKYCAPVAACLLVLVILFNHPMLLGNKHMGEAQPLQDSGMMTSDSAADSEAPQSAARAPAAKSDENGVIMHSFPEQQEDAAIHSPDGKGAGDDISIMEDFDNQALNSMDYSLFLTSYNEDLPAETARAVLDTYNSIRGTHFTFDENKVLTIMTLKAEGVRADMLREASSFRELMGDKAYSLLPLKDGNQEYTMLLPVFGSAEPYDDSLSAPLDIVYSQDGRTWLSSQYSGIPTSDSQVEFLLNRDEHERLVRDTFNVEYITDYTIVDVNYGYDYIAFMRADDNEYAVPLVNMGSLDSLETGRAYPVRDAMDSLADSLEKR